MFHKHEGQHTALWDSVKENNQFRWKETVGYQLHKIQAWQKTDEIICGQALDYNLCLDK